ncbi:MAG: outer membrane protein assembly factor BamD, partial [Pseudomonadota bacterium]
MYRSFQSSLVVLLAAFSVVANAALFEDADARRAILDLRQKLEATQQSNKSQLEEISVLRKALLELQNQIDALKAEQSSLRGANEQVLRALSDVQLKQKDILQELDTLLGKVDSRLSKLEPIKVVLDGLEFQADPAEKRDFEAALAVFRTADFAAAQNS